jgi:hypothetical protein
VEVAAARRSDAGVIGSVMSYALHVFLPLIRNPIHNGSLVRRGLPPDLAPSLNEVA